MTHPGLTVVERDTVAVVTIDRPERRNALSIELLRGLAGIFDSLSARPLRAVVLQGAAGCFSAGADLGELEGSLADLRVDNAVASAADAVRACSLPVVAAIEGPCVGAAVELAMSCDLCVVSDTAVFALPAVHLGLLYRPGAVAQLAAQLPPAVLSRLLLFGDRVRAEESVTLGLAAGPVAPATGALDAALAVAGRLPDPPSDALRATKRLLVELRRGADPGAFEELRRTLLTSPARAAALDAARERISGRRR
ncbi:MAG TPA: enoyl-CoA hydratase/isomerase family protein [Acidimicrobiales bacterium]|nr:enoyl-CoA hydratase/isomerase family protein [Acidimicrobiales bacterium]